jgi:CBS domain-containing protein
MAATLEAAEALIRTTQREFPVVDGAGRLRGVLTRDAMIRALQQAGPDAPVLDAMTGDIPTVPTRSSLEAALKLLTSSRAPAIGALDASGRLVGLLTAENVGEMMMLRAAQPEGRFGPWGRRPVA